MFDYLELHRFFASTRIKNLGKQEKILKTIFVHQMTHEKGLSLAELTTRCKHFATRKALEFQLGDLVGGGLVSVEQKGRKYVHILQYEGYKKLNEIMQEHLEENEE